MVTAKAAGTASGLSICKETAELPGGRGAVEPLIGADRRVILLPRSMAQVEHAAAAASPERVKSYAREVNLIELRGVFAPATTPFDPVTGEVDVVAMRKNVRRWLDAPLAGLVLFGSTGEGLLLDEEERERLLVSTRELLGAGQLLLAGTGAESTRATIRLTRAAAAAGADAALVHPPAYYKPQMTPEALRDHFVAVAEAAPIPVILYQIPPRYSGVELHSGLVGELSRHPNIIGIKDSSGDLKTLGAFVDACDRSCKVLVGNGSVLFGALEVGAGGGVLALALLAPRECAEIHRLWEAGDTAASGRLQERVAPVHRTVVGGLGVAGIKAGLDLLGQHGGPPRSPLKPLRNKERESVASALEQAGLLNVR